jgi:WD40 repeat protein
MVFLKHRIVELGDELTSVTFHSKAPLVLVSSDDGCAYIFNAKNGKEMNSFCGHTGPIRKASFTPNGKFVVSVSDDCTMKVWSVLKNNCISTFTGYKFHTEPIHCYDFYPSKNLVVTGGDDSVICISGIEKNETYYKSKLFPSPIQTITINDSTGVALIGCLDGSIEMFNIDSRHFLSSFKVEGAVTLSKNLPLNQMFISLSNQGDIVCFNPSNLMSFKIAKLGIQTETHACMLTSSDNLLISLENGLIVNVSLSNAFPN